MKKRLWAVCFAVVLSLSACARQEQTPAAAFQPPTEGVWWGMSPEEAMENPALSEDCILSDDGKVVVLQWEDRELWGKNADIEMIFNTQPQIGLLRLNVYFEDLSEEALIEILNRTYGDCTAADREGLPNRWESEKIADMPERIQERFRYMRVDGPMGEEERSGFTKEGLWDLYKNQPLVTVARIGNTLNYEGGNMALYRICDDDSAYEKLKEYLVENAYKESPNN